MTLTIDRPITGDISKRNRYSAQQEGPTEFLAAIDSALAVRGVESIIWDQNTPSWNDGEPCEFGINEVRVRFEGTTEEDEDNSDYGDGGITPWAIGYYRDKERDLPAAALALTDEEVAILKAALDTFDRFEDVAEANFGDPASITATKEGFHVEEYEGDY